MILLPLISAVQEVKVGGQSLRQGDQVPIIVTPKINTGRLEEKKSKLTRDTNVNYQYGPG